ncbi:hypothetical protein MNV49_005398 [Pseudohyphozyma bogoriensis]|nr:hypothetical protein MNV49_005398 [Pseudohyphozyma bogoriensis]
MFRLYLRLHLPPRPPNLPLRHLSSSQPLPTRRPSREELASPFAVLDFYPTWHSTAPPPSIVAAIAEASEKSKNVNSPPLEGESRRAGIRRRGLGSFWSRVAVGRLDKRGRDGTTAVGGGGASRAEDDDDEVEVTPMRRKRNWTHQLGSVPTTEAKLFKLLCFLTNGHLVKPESVALFHAQDEFRAIVSSRTYSVVLAQAYLASNERITREVLRDMKRRGVKWSVDVLRNLLREHVRRGNRDGARAVVDAFGRAGRKEPMVVGLGRRDVGSEGKGGPVEPKFVWAGKQKHVRQAKKKLEEGPAAPTTTTAKEPTRAPSGKGKKRKGVVEEGSSLVYTPDDSQLARQPATIPRDLTSVSSRDIVPLVTSLIEDYRGQEAFDVARSWLQAARPPSHTTQPWSPRLVGEDLRRSQVYAKTAVHLLNALLKSLFANDNSRDSIHNFVTYFIELHTANLKLVPSSYTLCTLLRPSRRQHPDARTTGFDDACATTNWFGTTYGLPPRLPTVIGYRRFTSLEAEPWALSNPVCHVSAQVAKEVLAAGMAEFRDRREGKEELVKSVRTWWGRLDKTGAGWGNRRLKLAVDEAVDVGLLREEERWEPRRRDVVGKDGEEVEDERGNEEEESALEESGKEEEEDYQRLTQTMTGLIEPELEAARA